VGLTTRTAMTLVHLGVDLGSVTTRTTLAKGLELAFARLGYEVIKRKGGMSGGTGVSATLADGAVTTSGTARLRAPETGDARDAG